MQESNVQTLGTLTGLLVNQTDTLFSNLSQSVGNSILNAECYMVYTLIAFVEPLLDGALRTCRLQKFQLDFTTLQESGFHFLIFYSFYCITLQAQYILKERKAFFNALDGDAQMLNVRNFHIV